MNFTFEYYKNGRETNKWYRQFLKESNKHSADCLALRMGEEVSSKKHQLKRIPKNVVCPNSTYLRIKLNDVIVGYVRIDRGGFTENATDMVRLRDIYILEKYRNNNYFKISLPLLIEFLSITAIELTVFKYDEYAEYYKSLGFETVLAADLGGVCVVHNSVTLPDY